LNDVAGLGCTMFAPLRTSSLRQPGDHHRRMSSAYLQANPPPTISEM
jgi:hypothetical protein